MDWTLRRVIQKLEQIEAKGFLPIPEGMYRFDEGIIGQILEREFDVPENNLAVGDLGIFELKGMRAKSSTLTLCHQKPQQGMTPIEIFDRFGYTRPSKRNPTILKKKLFTTIKGRRENNLGFILTSSGPSKISLKCKDEFICQWDLSKRLPKMGNIVLAIAETKGAVGSRNEQFHFLRASLLIGLKELSTLIDAQAVVIDFCIDQVVGEAKGPHDRGPHIRIPKSKLRFAYTEIKPIFEAIN